MDINRENLDSLFQTYSTAWQDGIGMDDILQDVMFLVTVFPSNSTANFYAWLAKTPGFRRWVGDRVYHNVESKRKIVENLNFEDSLRITRIDLEDDNYGVYTPLIQMMAMAWSQLKRSEIIKCFTSRATSTADADLTFTGQPLLSDSHAYGDYTIDNKSTNALSASEYQAARIAAANWRYEDGEEIMPRFTHLVVGEKLRTTGFAIVEAETINDGNNTPVPNPDRGSAQLVVWPELTGDYDDYWFLVDASKPVKPVALQIRRDAVPLMDTDPATLERTGFVDVLASGRMAASATFPHLVYGGVL